MLQPEKVPTGNHANDVIHALFIDWESGKMAVQEHFTDFHRWSLRWKRQQSSLLESKCR